MTRDDPLPELLEAGRQGVTSPSGAYSARVLPQRHRIELARAGQPVATLEGRWLRTVGLAFSTSDRWIAAAGYAGGVGVWETATGEPIGFLEAPEADDAGEGRLPVAFSRDDALLACGGRRLTFICTRTWTPIQILDLPTVALCLSVEPARFVVYEAFNGKYIRWTINLKTFEIEGADRMKSTRLYRGYFSTRPQAV